MTKSDLEREIITVLDDILPPTAESVTLSDRLGEDLGFESIDLLDILFRIEKIIGTGLNRREFMPDGMFIDIQNLTVRKLVDKAWSAYLGRQK